MIENHENYLIQVSGEKKITLTWKSHDLVFEGSSRAFTKLTYIS